MNNKNGKSKDNKNNNVNNDNKNNKNNKNNNNKKTNKANKKKNELAQPHDTTFKKLFGEIGVAKDVMEHNLPKEVLDQLDMNSLKRLDGSFISEKLKETFSDILYGVKINNRDAYVAILWEHKSYLDKYAVFQVAGYILDIWKRIIKEDKKELPVVIPIVVYHGAGSWNYKTNIRELIPDFDILPEYLKQMLPVINHEFINITAHTEEDIEEYEPVTRMVIRSLKYIHGPKDKLLEALILSIDEIDSVLDAEDLYYYINILLLYFSAVNKNLTEEEIRVKIQELGGKGEQIMTILQEREQKGIEQGRHEGIEIGRQEGIKKGELKRSIESARIGITKGYSIEIIMDMTGLTEEEIEDIRKEMSN